MNWLFLDKMLTIYIMYKYCHLIRIESVFRSLYTLWFLLNYRLLFRWELRRALNWSCYYAIIVKYSLKSWELQRRVKRLKPSPSHKAWLLTYQYSKFSRFKFWFEWILEGFELVESLSPARGLVLPPQRMRARHIELAREQELDGRGAGHTRSAWLAQRVQKRLRRLETYHCCKLS